MAQTSVAGETPWPDACSGAIQNGVPMSVSIGIVPRAVAFATSLAMPKSRSFTIIWVFSCWGSVMKMFSGLISRCTTPTL
jgi:hypothetical protein